MQMVHNMVVNYGLYKHMDVVVSGAESEFFAKEKKTLYQSYFLNDDRNLIG